jgi:Fe-S-cluster containining protein
MEPAAAEWQGLIARFDRWFEATAQRNPGVIPCRAGCSACCHGPFDISAADALLLTAGLATLPPAERQEVAARGQRLLARMRTMAPDWGAPYDIQALGDDEFDILCEALAEEPCPLLDAAGRCRVYAFRPLVCRMIGLPLLTAEGEVLENACPIQEEFPAYAALDPVPFDLAALEDREGVCQEAAAQVLFGGPGRAGFETTIAAVVAGG